MSKVDHWRERNGNEKFENVVDRCDGPQCFSGQCSGKDKANVKYNVGIEELGYDG